MQCLYLNKSYFRSSSASCNCWSTPSCTCPGLKSCARPVLSHPVLHPKLLVPAAAVQLHHVPTIDSRHVLYLSLATLHHQLLKPDVLLIHVGDQLYTTILVPSGQLLHVRALCSHHVSSQPATPAGLFYQISVLSLSACHQNKTFMF